MEHSQLKKSDLTWEGASTVQGGGKRRTLNTSIATLYFGRPDLEKGRARATRLLFAIGVDPRLDYLPGLGCIEELALLWRGVSLLRKAKP